MSVRFPILYIAEADAETAVMSSGVLAYLVEQMPNAPITLVASSASAPLLADTPGLYRTHILDKTGRFDWLGLWSRLRNTRWGLIVDMQGTRLSGRLRRQKRAVRGADRPGRHAVEDAAAVLQLDEVPAPRLFFSDQTRAVADALIRPDGRSILAVAPGAEWMGRRWPADRFSRVATALLNDDRGPLAGGRLLIVGDEADRDLAHTVRVAVPRDRVIEAQGRLTRLQTAAALRHANLFIGGEAIWTQLAVAAGTPTVGVYGPSDESRIGPWGGVSVRGPRSLEEFRVLDPRLNQAIQHMLDLPAERVLKAAKALLAERATG